MLEHNTTKHKTIVRVEYSQNTMMSYDYSNKIKQMISEDQQMITAPITKLKAVIKERNQ